MSRYVTYSHYCNGNSTTVTTECSECGASVSNRSTHDEFHNALDNLANAVADQLGLP